MFPKEKRKNMQNYAQIENIDIYDAIQFKSGTNSLFRNSIQENPKSMSKAKFAYFREFSHFLKIFIYFFKQTF